MSSHAAHHNWERTLEKTWDSLQERDGRLVVDTIAKDAQFFAGSQAGNAKRRFLLRRVVILVDNSSEVVEERDLRPNRLVVFGKHLIIFLNRFFASNPTSEIAIIGASDQTGVLISPMTSSIVTHRENIAAKFTAAGKFSIQNAVEAAVRVLDDAPPHSTREIISLISSRYTIDPDPLSQLYPMLRAKEIVVSCIMVGCDVYAFRQLCDNSGSRGQTKGDMHVIRTVEELDSVLAYHCVPKAAPEDQRSTLIRMGFPVRTVGTIMRCTCHKEYRQSMYNCPRCSAPYCDIPTTCSVCRLQLVSATHIARTAAHLRPVPEVKRVVLNERCLACKEKLPTEREMVQCTACGVALCLDCARVIQDDFRSCIGCQLKSTGATIPTVLATGVTKLTNTTTVATKTVLGGSRQVPMKRARKTVIGKKDAKRPSADLF
ncbi:General transcription factor IIH subunit 2 TF2H2 [Carpediemonas membranifera]|uniref:General transcription factor IIH subunit 2 TF2H2 n=1 Tax=Carpediemonas membranifera TaxID=201153 RepID=A0A8J6B8C9_9EUKA|nr:General transcription factor IIH subunit 2 TF2H2 [Carpediemonas membranifera]|eukprot:KAG9392127.1 General transcription factor IIH subunit 2 TF2H2 [Carpediemonas membranifera]